MTDRLTMLVATTTGLPGSSTKLTTEVTADSHGYHPDEITGWPLESLIKQAWELGVDRLRLVHGHGRDSRGVTFNTSFRGRVERTILLTYPPRVLYRLVDPAEAKSGNRLIG
jgi:hypothetical protein